MTDFYPQEEGAVFDTHSYIVPCYPTAAISEMAAVKLVAANTVAGRISVTPSADLGEGVAIALKAASGAGVPSRIPILFHGVAKITLTATAVSGEFVMSALAASATQYTAGGDIGTFLWANLCVGTGASNVMGMLLQTTGGASDEALLLVGKTA